MVDMGPLKKKWREVAEAKARVKGLQKEGIGVGMVDAFVSNLEAQSRCQLGQGKEEREIVKWSMHKILKDCQLKLSSKIREQ